MEKAQLEKVSTYTHSTLQYNTVQHSTDKYDTVQGGTGTTDLLVNLLVHVSEAVCQLCIQRECIQPVHQASGKGKSKCV